MSWDADAHFTPSPVALQLLQRLRAMGEEPDSILDLGAGAGSLARAARAVWPRARIVGVELRAEERPHLSAWCDDVIVADALSLGLLLLELRPALLISNPPYQRATAFAALAARLGCPAAVLMRSTWGSSCSAHALLRELPPAWEMTIGGRPQWRPGRPPDKVPHTWLIWRPGDRRWHREMLPRLPHGLLTWSRRPGTEPELPTLLPPDLIGERYGRN